jgi:surface protein
LLLFNGCFNNNPIEDSVASSIYFDSNTCKCPTAIVGDTEVINGVTYTVVDNTSIITQIAAANYNLCTTFVTDMSELFKDNTSFNSNISFWNTSAVNNMRGMFYNVSIFNKDIGNWDTSKVTNMEYMFNHATSFNQNLTGWCVSNITTEPISFAPGSSLRNVNRPVWGTCP